MIRSAPAGWLLSLLGLLGLLGSPNGGRLCAAPPDAAVAARIDQHLAEGWAAHGIAPAPPATDAEFLRRVWLDLCGKIPPINDADGRSGVRGFLADDRPDKRARLVDSLLARPAHARHFANIWREALLPREVDLRRFGGDRGFQTWLRRQFADNVPYDTMVVALLEATGTATSVSPVLFYTARELKPEELASSTARVLLGSQIQCAQCHDHPFDAWNREDFWGYAAFFARLQRSRSPGRGFQVVDASQGEVEIPDTDQPVVPRFFGGDPSPDVGGVSRRARLADWVTSSDNEYFPRAAVNRVWALMFGRGLVHPVDDMGPHNPASHPELLDELATYFVGAGCDLNQLVRTLAATRAYQLSSKATADSRELPELFARMSIKTLSGQQLYDCLFEATRNREPAPASGQRLPGALDDRQKTAFLAKFPASNQGAAEYESGIPQALTLMNGRQIRQATDLSQSDLLLSLDAPFFSDATRVEVLFLSTLSRPPSPRERTHFVSYVRRGGATGDRRQALSDVLWALLNCAEFCFNH